MYSVVANGSLRATGDTQLRTLLMFGSVRNASTTSAFLCEIDFMVELFASRCGAEVAFYLN